MCLDRWSSCHSCLIFSFPPVLTDLSVYDGRLAHLIHLLTSDRHSSGLGRPFDLVRLTHYKYVWEADERDKDISDKEAATRLTQISQGNQSVADFSITFRALAGETGWGQEPLITLFSNALSDPVKDALAAFDPPATFDALVSATIRIDNRVRERERQRSEKRFQPRFPVAGVSIFATSSALPREAPSSDTPMQMGSLSFKVTEGHTPWAEGCKSAKHTPFPSARFCFRPMFLMFIDICRRLSVARGH